MGAEPDTKLIVQPLSETEGGPVRNLFILGVVLAVLGAGSLLFGHFSYSDTKPVLDAGPIHVATQEEHHVSIPTIAGALVLAAGFGFMLIGRRAS